jgi:hypothetical protein
MPMKVQFVKEVHNKNINKQKKNTLKGCKTKKQFTNRQKIERVQDKQQDTK